jgi:DNA-binding GntR family transcriptional regulator/flavin reductase (DIM6/NTAB) family NADH-FMN oxidoreductase RutF
MSTEPVASETFRKVAGHLASGVTVVTTRAGQTDYGTTASSVASLSLTPPMMLVCLNKESTTGQAVLQSGVYAVNVLSHGQADLARTFAAKGRDKFCGVGYWPGQLGVPLIEGALAHIECRVTEQVSGGTHIVFLGEVQSAAAMEGNPLAYYRGDFGRFEFGRDDAIYHDIRRRILRRDYPPGQPLEVDDLARALDAERTAVFYALTRLTADALVDRDPDRGYVVVPVDVPAAAEARDARCTIEGGVVDMTIGRASPAGLAELRRRLDRMVPYIAGDHFVDIASYLEANDAFHEHIVSLAHNPSLLAVYQRLSVKALIARALGSTKRTSSRAIELQAAFTHAYENGRSDAAKQALCDYAEFAKQYTRRALRDAGGKV